MKHLCNTYTFCPFSIFHVPNLVCLLLGPSLPGVGFHGMSEIPVDLSTTACSHEPPCCCLIARKHFWCLHVHKPRAVCMCRCVGKHDVMCRSIASRINSFWVLIPCRTAYFLIKAGCYCTCATQGKSDR